MNEVFKKHTYVGMFNPHGKSFLVLTREHDKATFQ